MFLQMLDGNNFVRSELARFQAKPWEQTHLEVNEHLRNRMQQYKTFNNGPYNVFRAGEEYVSFQRDIEGFLRILSFGGRGEKSLDEFCRAVCSPDVRLEGLLPALKDWQLTQNPDDDGGSSALSE